MSSLPTERGGAELTDEVLARVRARRATEREALLELARRFAAALVLETIRAVVVFGSVARGDFNLWSDVDVLVVADSLPAGRLARFDTLGVSVPRVQAVVWTPEEFQERLARDDPIAVEAIGCGVALRGSLAQ